MAVFQLVMYTRRQYVFQKCTHVSGGEASLVVSVSFSYDCCTLSVLCPFSVIVGGIGPRAERCLGRGSGWAGHRGAVGMGLGR